MDSFIQPLANVLGLLMNLLFNMLSAIGIGNIGIAIILFTIIIKAAMFPLTLSQQKTVKVSKLMQPEIQAVKRKYKGSRDPEAQQKQNEEIRLVYAKYGASQTGGCIQMVIQLPILLALYNVFRNIPQHIDGLKSLLTGILSTSNGIGSSSNFVDTMNANFSGIDWTNQSAAIAKMNAFTGDEWARLKSLFPQYADLITNNSEQIVHMNRFLGVNMSISPNQVMGLAILIPILAGVSQLISTWLSQNNTAMGDDKASQLTQKLMIFSMPLISVFIAFTVPAGLGLYWIATAVIQIVMQLIIDAYYDKVGPEKIVEKNLERKRKKIEKKGVTQEELIRSASIRTRSINTLDKDNGSGSIRNRANLVSGSVKAKNSKGSNATTPEKGSGHGTPEPQKHNPSLNARAETSVPKDSKKKKKEGSSLADKVRMVSDVDNKKNTNKKKKK